MLVWFDVFIGVIVFTCLWWMFMRIWVWICMFHVVFESSWPLPFAPLLSTMMKIWDEQYEDNIEPSMFPTSTMVLKSKFCVIEERRKALKLKKYKNSSTSPPHHWRGSVRDFMPKEKVDSKIRVIEERRIRIIDQKRKAMKKLKKYKSDEDPFQ